MVRLHVQSTRDEEFFDYMCGPTASIEMITRDVVSIYALRLVCLNFSDSADPPSSHGVNQSAEISDRAIKSTGLVRDPMSYEDPTLMDNIRASLSCCSEKDVRAKLDIASSSLERMMHSVDKVHIERAGLTGSGVPEQQRALKLYEENQMENTQLWCCGKPFCATPGKPLLHDFVSVNDKSTLTIYVRSAKDGPPPRPNAIDQTTYRNMVAFYHKREEDLKHLRQADEASRDRDHFLAAPWADPKQLKRNLVGNGGTINYSFYFNRQRV